MIAALVQFDLDEPVVPAEMKRGSEEIAPRYQGMPGLVLKHFVSTDGGARVGGFYLWESREAANALYESEQWLARVREVYGGDPQITWFDCPVVVDNHHGDVIVEARTG